MCRGDFVAIVMIDEFVMRQGTRDDIGTGFHTREVLPRFGAPYFWGNTQHMLDGVFVSTL